MKNDLLPSDVRAAIPKLYAQEGRADPIVYAKLFPPFFNGTWYVIEFDGEDTLYCYVELMDNELGYQSLKELQDTPACICGKWIKEIHGIERDIFFRPKPLSEVMKKN